MWYSAGGATTAGSRLRRRLWVAGPCGAARKESKIVKSGRGTRVVFAILLAAVVVAVAGWGLSRSSALAQVVGGGAAEEKQDQPVGRYQVAVPNLVLDTATGKLMGGNGQVLEPPLEPNGSEVGRYSVDAYVTSVTRSVSLNVIGVPAASVDLVKGYVIADTKTGRIVRQRVYHSAPLQAGDL
jgi:hypothetical protein